MQSDIAGRDVRSESLRHPRSIARRMSAVAGGLFVAAIVVGIPEAQRRLTLVLQLDGRSPATILTALAAFTILLVLTVCPRSGCSTARPAFAPSRSPGRS